MCCDGISGQRQKSPQDKSRNEEDTLLSADSSPDKPIRIIVTPTPDSSLMSKGLQCALFDRFIENLIFKTFPLSFTR